MPEDSVPFGRGPAGCGAAANKQVQEPFPQGRQGGAEGRREEEGPEDVTLLHPSRGPKLDPAPARALEDES